jgi:hypothetical protein
MHPIIMITSDKNPAIGKAVSLLEEAGFDVRVLNSGTAKLIDFLGALAGVNEDKPTEDKPAEPDTKATPDEPKEPDNKETMEAIVSNEKIQVQIVEGSEIILHPKDVVIGAHTTFSLNECQYAFWPNDAENVQHTLDIEINGAKFYARAKISNETTDPPVLKIGADWFKNAMSQSF